MEAKCVIATVLGGKSCLPPNRIVIHALSFSGEANPRKEVLESYSLSKLQTGGVSISGQDDEYDDDDNDDYDDNDDES